MSLISFAQATMRRVGRLAAAAALGLAAFGAADQAAAGQVFTGQFGTGNTWNLYEAVNTGFTFKDALEAAARHPDPTGGDAVGHVVTLSSLAENTFVHSTAGGGDRWIGLTDRAGAAPGAMESALTADQTTMGWAWVTGEAFTFQNWNAGEPNDSTGEDAVHMRGVVEANWNDHKSGFGENDPPLTPADPESTDETAAPAFGFIIEWSKNLPTEPPGFPTTRPDPGIRRVFPTPLAPLPGPVGTASAFGVLEVRDLGNTVGGREAIRDAIAKILSPDGTRVTGTAAKFDLTDPDTNPVPAGSVAGPPLPFISDTAGVDDDGIQSVIKGTVQVPAGQGGAYTFNVHSDDGFALRVLSQATGGPLAQHQFTAARGGNVDQDGALTFTEPTGDSNTQGVINLAPGTYDVEFAVFEDGGGAFWEVSTQKGDFVTGGSGLPQWILLGDGSSLPQAGVTQAARLTAPATVQNFDFQGDIAGVVANFRGPPAPTPTAQGTVDEVILKGNGPICCGRPGGGLAASQQNLFPNGGADNFSTAVTGSLQVVDTNGAAGETLTFGLFADDNAGLHIVGQSFTGVSDFDAPDPDNNVAILDNPEGGTDQWLIADYRTGNTNAFGLITLPEGTYSFEAFQLEEGGDSGLEVWVASGDQLATGFGGAFVPLTTATLFLAANQGLPLVAGPGTGPAARPGDFDSDGDVDGNDFLVWQRGVGTTHNAATLATWKANFGMTGAEAAAGAVPEPASLGLALLALGAVRAARRVRG